MATHSSILTWRMDSGAWGATVRRVSKSQTQLKRPVMHTTLHREDTSLFTSFSITTVKKDNGTFLGETEATLRALSSQHKCVCLRGTIW